MKMTKINKKRMKIKICNSLFLKMKGLMFTFSIKKNCALLFCFDKETLFGRSIHMLFVFYPINVFWLDKNFIVVDSALAKPFRLYYNSKKPSKYVLETHKDICINIGEKINLDLDK